MALGINSILPLQEVFEDALPVRTNKWKIFYLPKNLVLRIFFLSIYKKLLVWNMFNEVKRK